MATSSTHDEGLPVEGQGIRGSAVHPGHRKGVGRGELGATSAVSQRGLSFCGAFQMLKDGMSIGVHGAFLNSKRIL